MIRKIKNFTIVSAAILTLTLPTAASAATTQNTANTSNQIIPTNLRGRWFGSNKAGARQFTRIGKHFLLISRYMYFHHHHLQHSQNHFNMRGVVIFSPNQKGNHKLQVKVRGYKNGNPVYQLAPHSPLYWTEKANVDGKYQTVLKSISNGQEVTSTSKPIDQRNNK